MLSLRKKGSRGFTLIEMLIVISLIVILISIAVPNYRSSIVHARESVLRQNLFTLRSVISQYTLDKQKAPQSLDDLVQAGYIKMVPTDPITSKPDWTVEQEDATLMSVDQQESGIDDVHSASDQISSDGTAYNTW